MSLCQNQTIALNHLCLNIHAMIRLYDQDYARQHSTSKIIFFIIYLLEDEQELSLGMLIRLRCIYIFLLFHAIILSILDVLIYIYSNYILFFGTNLLTQCPVPLAIFCLFLVFQNISTERSPNATKLFGDFFLDIRDTRSFGRGPEDRGGGHEPPGPALGGVGAPWCLVGPPLPLLT